VFLYEGSEWQWGSGNEYACKYLVNIFVQHVENIMKKMLICNKAIQAIQTEGRRGLDKFDGFH
jgi:hypothetical protein